MKQRHRLELIGITYNQIESGVYALILQQADGPKRIPIIIGFPEAQAIECKLQEVATPRPLTHDTMVASLQAFGISLLEVEIRKLSNGVFAADLLFSDGVNERIVDSRSSDAVALAIRVGAPIYTSDTVLNEAGFDPDMLKPQKTDEEEFILSETSVSDENNLSSDDLTSFSDEQLHEAMMKAAENENYEDAAKYRAEIIKRKNNNGEA